MKTKQEQKDQALKKYEVIQEKAYKELRAIRDPAIKKYEAIREPAFKEYEAKCKAIDELYGDIIIIDGKKYKLIK